MEEESNWKLRSPEIVEIGEDNSTVEISRRDDDDDDDDKGSSFVKEDDVYVAVGKDDLDVVKWAIDHAVSPRSRVFLVHVFPPITYIPTPVGMLSRSQLSREQLRYYINQDNNRRRNLLQKYISLCTDAKVSVDTMLLESTATAKAILQLIPILNITNLVMGTKRPPFTRRPRRGLGKGEFVKKNAPKSCEVTIVSDGKKVATTEAVKAPSNIVASERNFFDCICFSGKSS